MIRMYEKMDKFLNVETWHSAHPLDERRFYEALNQIVDDTDFNADAMAEYIRDKFGVSRDDDDHPLARSIEHYQAAAWAVREFIKATGR